MKVTGQAMIFANKHESMSGTWYTYATGISSKKEDGSYASMYIDVKFRKGITVENKTKINIKDGFLTFREFTANGGDVVKRIVLMVMDFEIAEESRFASAPVDAPSEPQAETQSGFTALSNDDIPF